MKCFNCGATLGREAICQECGTNVKIYKKIIFASNEYYNDALKKANVRDLSGAILSLKTSLHFDKHNIVYHGTLLMYFFLKENQQVGACGGNLVDMDGNPINDPNVIANAIAIVDGQHRISAALVG